MTVAFVEVLGRVSVFPVEEGQRHALDPNQTFRINRGPGDLTLAHARVSRVHARLQYAKGGWWAIDETSTNGTLVNGRNANPAIRLVPGDVIDIAGVLLLRFGTPPARHEALERSISEQPDDESRWRVWQDWMLENSDPVGVWMNAHERPMTDRAAILGPLARAFKGRELSCTWNKVGFVSHLAMQFHTLADLPNALWLMRHLDDVPACRFISSLTLEILPIALRDHTAPAITMVEALATSSLPRSLRTLHFAGQLPAANGAEVRSLGEMPGPMKTQAANFTGFRAMTEIPPRLVVEAALAHVRRRAKHLETLERGLITWKPSQSP